MLYEWTMAVHLEDGGCFTQHCSQEWENVEHDAREAFDTLYEGASVVQIDIYNNWSDKEPTHKIQWLSKEEIV